MKYYIDDKEVTTEELKAEYNKIKNKNLKEQTEWNEFQEEYNSNLFYEAGNGWRCQVLMLERMEKDLMYFKHFYYESFY